MEKENILNELSEKGYTCEMIASSLNVSLQSIYLVISKGKGSERIAKAVSIALEKSLEEVFPFYQKKEKAKQSKENKRAYLESQLRHIA